MIRALILLGFSLQLAFSWSVQASAPLVRTSLSDVAVIPGQPVIYRVTVLVPTWMLSPPVFPSFEVPNLIVRLPSRSSQAVSETIDGETWSGVSRSYRLYPMLEGTFPIPSDEIRVIYADPETRAPIVVQVPTSSFEVSGKAPEGAGSLDPFLAARSLTLSREIDGDPDALVPADALILKTTVQVEGVSPMFVPPVTSIPQRDGYSVYANEPVITEKEERGSISGERVEMVTLIAENEGVYEIPEATLSWYNLETAAIETVRAPGYSISITGSTERPDTAARALNWRVAGFVGLGLLLATLVLVRIRRRLMHRLRETLYQRRERYLASEQYAQKALNHEISKHNLSGVSRSSLRWQMLVRAEDPTINWHQFEAALLALREQSYKDVRHREAKDERMQWQSLRDAVRQVRVEYKRNKKLQRSSYLAALNPRF